MCRGWVFDELAGGKPLGLLAVGFQAWLKLPPPALSIRGPSLSPLRYIVGLPVIAEQEIPQGMETGLAVLSALSPLSQEILEGIHTLTLKADFLSLGFPTQI